jgi:hypothetical protein
MYFQWAALMCIDMHVAPTLINSLNKNMETGTKFHLTWQQKLPPAVQLAASSVISEVTLDICPRCSISGGAKIKSRIIYNNTH